MEPSKPEAAGRGGRASILLSFVGNHDAVANEHGDRGPVLSLLASRPFSRIFLIYTGDRYLEIARTVAQAGRELLPGAAFNFVSLELDSPVDYEEIYTKLAQAVTIIRESSEHLSPDYSVLIDPGTPQMQTVWFLFVKSGFLPARLLQGVPAQFAGGAYKVREIDLSSPVLPEIRPALRREKRTPAREAGKWIVPKKGAQIIGEERAFVEVVDAARKVAGYDISVLIRGEPGTGKGIIARLIHEESARREGPFLSLNCAAISPSLAESELFGHAKGAYTGAESERLGQIRAADRGTMLLDEVGDLPFEIQPKLLRVLEDHRLLQVGHDKEIEVDVRVIAATNRDLEELIAAGRFRRDLYDRLAQYTLLVPPLRDRAADIPLLARRFMEQWNERYQEEKSLSEETVRFLVDYPWPGNVRELQNSISQMCALARGGVIPPELLPPALRRYFSSSDSRPTIDLGLPGEGMNLKAFLFNVEKSFYQQALERSGGNREKAAALLGLNGPAFRKALKERFGM